MSGVRFSSSYLWGFFHFFVIIFLLPVASASAQTSVTLTGVVQDPQGAVVQGAKVTARSLETNITRTAESDAEGRYTIPEMRVGRYEVRAEQNGFKQWSRNDITLALGETAVVNITLEPSAISENVNIEGTDNTPLVNTTTPELSYLVGERAIRELPLNGRNVTDLVFLQPNTAPFPHRDGGSAVAHGLGASINGQDPRSNVYLLDGTVQNDFTNGPAGSAAGTALGVETIQEFRVETNSYSAQFGRNSGGQINAVSKSGSNKFHGTLFEFHRNDNFDAREFNDGEQPEFKRNQFGAVLGGPIRRDRTFFFAGYEGLREGRGRTISTPVPDDNARIGILPTEVVIVDPAVRPYLNEFPRANGRNLGGGLALYTFGFNQILDQDFVQARVDQRLGSSQQLFGRYTYDDASYRQPTDFPQFPRTFISTNQYFTAEHTWVMSATTVNTLRGSFSRTKIGQNVEANTSTPLQPFVPGRLVGDIDIVGSNRFGPQSSANLRLVQNVFGVEDNVAHIRGIHNLKFGGLVERYQDNMFNPTFSLGIYTFPNLRSFLVNRPARFIGLPAEGALDRYWRFTLFGFYLQDDIRLHRRFTLNAGLRYEFATMPVDLYGRDSTLINLSDPAPTVGQLYENPTKKNLSPRLGFAWDLTGDGKTSLRGGYGIYFNTNNQQNLIVTVTNPPATPRVVIANPTFPNPPFERGVGNSIRPVEFNLKNPYVNVYNLNVQRQLPFDTVVTVGYAGARGVHLLRNTDANIPTPQRLADGTLFFPPGQSRPNPAFSTIELKKSDGNSWYNALIFEVRKRWSYGFDFQSSYTFSRNIDTTQASTFFSDATNGTVSAMPEFPGFEYNKGLADFHAKHNWVMNFTWQLPFGKDLNGMAKTLLDGWQLTGISTMRSGSPLTVFLATNNSRSQWSPSQAPGIGFDRPSLAPGRTHESAVTGNPDAYFDASAFVLPPAGTLGTLGRGTFIGPNFRSFDLSAAKNTRAAWLGENGNVQFRVEAFNLFNRTNFGIPNLIAFSPSFGRISLPVNPGRAARQIQLAVRLSF